MESSHQHKLIQNFAFNFITNSPPKKEENITTLEIFVVNLLYMCLYRKKRSQSKSTRSRGSVATERTVEEPPKERSVDDIIASLKAQQEQGSVTLSLSLDQN